MEAGRAEEDGDMTQAIATAMVGLAQLNLITAPWPPSGVQMNPASPRIQGVLRGERICPEQKGLDKNPFYSKEGFTSIACSA